ncbi:MAG TPA: glycine cleavage system aminomethyltransferase GcvT [Micropepsaceae bacterium]|nr:glycine cleavage system aminomethyltransferase GcvT [Micropepsaceae bacterium]
MTPAPLQHTPLHALHLSLGAKMVPFAGYEMPLQYPTGIIKEHLHTRERAGLFDVSHMGQAFLDGADAARALETLTPADIVGLGEGQMRYALLLNESGGIKDDFMAARLAGERALYLVVNAGTKEADFAYIAERTRGNATLIPQPTRALLALQGPMAERALARHAEGVANLGFMRVGRFTVAGAPAIVSRSGYTGEDGFEISLEAADAEGVARTLLAEAEVLPIGLGARDSLRLEAGLCLYGHDIDETTSPIAAGLAWVIGKRRKLARDFPAAERSMAELLEGTKRRRVGIRLAQQPPAREGATIVENDGRAIGRVTSGGYGPSAGAPIAMGYVDVDFAADGTDIAIVVRETPRAAQVVPLPFVPHRYKRKNGI